MFENWEYKAAIVAGLALGAYELPSMVAHTVTTVLSSLAWAALGLTWRLRRVRPIRRF